MTIAIETLEKQAKEWMVNDIDKNSIQEIQSLLDAKNFDELEDRFYTEIDFGTAGMRGLLEAGANRMNEANVVKTTQALATVIRSQINGKNKVVVGFDGRHKSSYFAQLTTQVLLANDFEVILFEETVPTPVCAYTLKKSGAAAAVVITASHNPPKYNGYKVYWDNGAQIISPIDSMIRDQRNFLGSAKNVTLANLEEARQKGKIEKGDPYFEKYTNDVIKFVAFDFNRDGRKDLSIVYTAMHGVGSKTIQKVFSQGEFSKLHLVEEQDKPDPNFSTVKFPNPEEKGAMDLAFKLATRVKADIVIANDPDADRLAIAIPFDDDKYHMLTGNQVGTIMAHELLQKSENVEKALVINTIVSTSMLEKLANHFGAKYLSTLTGFKWIANLGLKKADDENLDFVMGFEEALGYCIGRLVADKDGISAAYFFAALAASLKSKGSSLLTYLNDIYRKVGYHMSTQENFWFEGAEGQKKMLEFMEYARKNPPQEFNGKKVLVKTDLFKGSQEVIVTKEEIKLDYPRQNVLWFDYEGGHRMIIRPSGTEPKLKIYYEVCEAVGVNEEMLSVVNKAKVTINQMIEKRKEIYSQLD